VNGHLLRSKKREKARNLKPGRSSFPRPRKVKKKKSNKRNLFVQDQSDEKEDRETFKTRENRRRGGAGLQKKGTKEQTTGIMIFEDIPL